MVECCAQSRVRHAVSPSCACPLLTLGSFSAIVVFLLLEREGSPGAMPIRSLDAGLYEYSGGSGWGRPELQEVGVLRLVTVVRFIESPGAVANAVLAVGECEPIFAVAPEAHHVRLIACGREGDFHDVFPVGGEGGLEFVQFDEERHPSRMRSDLELQHAGDTGAAQPVALIRPRRV